MDFFEHQDRARRNTGLLVVYFVIAVIAIIVAVYFAVAGVLFWGNARDALGAKSNSLWFPDVFGVVSLGTTAVVACGSLYKIAELSGGGEVVAHSLGGQLVPSNTTVLSERVLLNVVEEMALASGTPVPPVYLMYGEQGINAFAAGTTPQNAVIGITQGAIDTLKRDELQGVIAHEFSHILNGDMKLNIRLIGVLNGLLLIAMIGYVLMRTGSNRTYFSNSSDGDRKGGNPLPLLGLLLYIIGYVGVFFGHLIKSAVSRQREFLADASAVQFTRLPEGIAGALKKIGGMMQGSRLRAVNAEEASHMFFGNALRQSFLEMLSTHPPLDERIRRIDPNFDGKFPVTREAHLTERDVIDPETLAKRRASAAPTAMAASFAVDQQIAVDPQAVVAQIGAPDKQHIEYADTVLRSLPPEISSAVRDPLGAIAVIYGLLLDNDNRTVHDDQMAYLEHNASPQAYAETVRVLPVTLSLPPEAKLPIVAMVLPALKNLSARQLQAFHDDVVFLIRADTRLSLFEYAVHRLILKRLLPRLERQPDKPQRYVRLEPLLPACAGLLSALAYAGSRDDAEAERAFANGVNQLQVDRAKLALLPRADATLRAVDQALDEMAGAVPALKKPIIAACAACVSADGHTTIEEAELLRVISDALDCPMPPLLNA